MKKTHTEQYACEFKQWMGVKAVFGHLHEFRQIPNTHPPVHSVRLSVPQGRGEKVRYCAMELIVETLPVFQLLNAHAERINDQDSKATMTFNFYGAYAKAYALKAADGSYKLNENGELELRPFIAGRLTHISYLKVDGNVVHGRGVAETAQTTDVANVVELDQVVSPEKEKVSDEANTSDTSTKRKLKSRRAK